VFCGSAFKNKAIQPLLDGVVNYLPSPDDVPPAVSYDGADVRFSNCLEPLAALVFKIMSDDYVNNLSYVRIYSGVLIRGCTVSNPRTKILEKVTRIFKMHANVKSEISFVIAGDIAAITGFKNVITGDTLCELDKSIDLFKMKVPVPVIQMAIEPQLAGDQGKLTSILTKFASEDPSLLINKNADSGQIILAGMGELHLEVIIDRIGREYSINLKTNAPQVAYRETISRPRVEEYTHKKQSGGSGQFARVKLMFEQNGTNEFKFESKIIGGAIPKEFIPGVKRGLEEAFLCGPASGFPVIRIKATLLDGEYHDVDSSLLAFEIAAKFCYKQAVINVGALVLEPIMRVEVTMPSDCVGNVVCDLIAKRGRILSQVTSNKNAVVICLAPLAMLFKYIDSLRSLSKGRGSYSMGFECYSDMKNGETEVRAT
ncbi:MAG: EF-Tu/IF-2/RF-3 family GTPase, partial [Candidatus Hodgkinia cicadicola]